MSPSPDYIRTGSLSLDISLGGGWKRGSIVDLQGTEGSGKTTLAQHAVFNTGPEEYALWIACGTSFPRRSMDVAAVAPRTAEEAFEVILTSIDYNPGIIVLDSVEGMVRETELNSSYDRSRHREFGQELRNIKNRLRDSPTVVMFLSRPRANSPGLRGTGISEFATQKVSLTTARLHQDGVRRVSASTGASFWVIPGNGIDWATDLIDVASDYGLIEVSGSWYFIPDTGFRVQGKAELKNYLAANLEHARDLYEKTREKAFLTAE